MSRLSLLIFISCCFVFSSSFSFCSSASFFVNFPILPELIFLLSTCMIGVIKLPELVINTSSALISCFSVKDFFLNKGLLLRPLGDVIYIMPPYCILDKELNYAYKIIYEGLKKI